MQVCFFFKLILWIVLFVMWCLTLATIFHSFKEIKKLNKELKKHEQENNK